MRSRKASCDDCCRAQPSVSIRDPPRPRTLDIPPAPATHLNLNSRLSSQSGSPSFYSLSPSSPAGPRVTPSLHESPHSCCRQKSSKLFPICSGLSSNAVAKPSQKFPGRAGCLLACVLRVWCCCRLAVATRSVSPAGRSLLEGGHGPAATPTHPQEATHHWRPVPKEHLPSPHTCSSWPSTWSPPCTSSHCVPTSRPKE